MLQPRLIYCFCLFLIQSGSMLNRTDDVSASHRYVRFDGLNVLNRWIYFRGFIIRSTERIEAGVLCYHTCYLTKSAVYIEVYILPVSSAKTTQHSKGGYRSALWQRLIAPQPLDKCHSLAEGLPLAVRGFPYFLLYTLSNWHVY